MARLSILRILGKLNWTVRDANHYFIKQDIDLIFNVFSLLSFEKLISGHLGAINVNISLLRNPCPF